MASSGGGGSKRVVICGGGVIGAATAFYLAKLGLSATVTATAAAAAPAGGGAPGARLGAPLPAWLDGRGVLASSALGSTASTAQVHPARLTAALMAAAERQAGAALLLGTVVGVRRDDGSGAVRGVRVRRWGQEGEEGEEEELAADAVVLAMGPWTGAARAWLPGAPATAGQKYHSVVLRPAAPVGGTCVFTSFRTADGRSVEPELYPRPDGTVYVCGEPQALPMPPEGPAAVTVERARCEALQAVAGALASGLAGAPVEAAQACYLPLCDDGLPAIGPLPGVPGAFVATGHGCWGILNAPATGRAVAEMVAGAALTLDVSAFDPARLCGR
ncbi:TDA3 [Scenedesmus sp. PABB004]|nr:TDA3 [Scenedesmus sp. PABB004]